MENASKALLIAAAVLIVILLVAFGMMVLNSTSGTQDSATTTGKAISAAVFNAKFKPYIGANKSKEDVLELFEIMENSNTENNERFVYLKVRNSAKKIDGKNITKPSNENNTYVTDGVTKFHVYEYYDKDGYIRYIRLVNADKVEYMEYDNKLSEAKGW